MIWLDDSPSEFDVYARPALAYALLEDATLDLEAWIARSVAATMLRAEARAFLAGEPTRRRPRGLFLFRLQALQARLGERRRARRRLVWPKVRRGKWWGAAGARTKGRPRARSTSAGPSSDQGGT